VIPEFVKNIILVLNSENIISIHSEFWNETKKRLSFLPELINELDSNFIKIEIIEKTSIIEVNENVKENQNDVKNNDIVKENQNDVKNNDIVKENQNDVKNNDIIKENQKIIENDNENIQNDKEN
jgi:hypothetical protein